MQFQPVALRKCHHYDTVKLIWGPPGTGKTKTVAALLFSLLKLKNRTLTYNPTNTAVLEVADCLLSIVKDSLEYGTHGLGDIVLFGNSSRMKVDSYQDLRDVFLFVQKKKKDVFLDYRTDKLLKCFAPPTGWKHYLGLMISLLEVPQMQYRLYKLDGNDGEEEDLVSIEEFAKQKYSNLELVYSLYKQNEENDDDPVTLEQFVKERYSSIEEQYNLYKEEKRRSVMALDQFVMQRFSFTGKKLKFCMQTLYMHLPTSFIPFEMEKNMFRALDLLKSPEIFLRQSSFKHAVDDYEDGESTDDIFGRLSFKREECLIILRSLSEPILLGECKPSFLYSIKFY